MNKERVTVIGMDCKHTFHGPLTVIAIHIITFPLLELEEERLIAVTALQRDASPEEALSE